MSEERCERFGKWFRGCNFEARYDESSMSIPEYLGIGMDELEHVKGSTPKKRTYILDVCTTCGKKVIR